MEEEKQPWRLPSDPSPATHTPYCIAPHRRHIQGRSWASWLRAVITDTQKAGGLQIQGQLGQGRELKGKETETQAESLKRRKRTHRAKPQIIRPERETRCSQGRVQLD